MQNTEKRYSLKAMIAASAATVALLGAVGGTVAWLIAESDTVTNTFTYGDINITLTEDDVDEDGDPTANTYEMVPGNAIAKNPTITVEADSEASWLFVKLEESDNFDTFLTYELAEGWTALEGVDGVYYQEAAATGDAAVEYGVLANDEVVVAEDITKEQFNALDATGAFPTLTVSAYAVQKDNIATAADAWALANQ